MRVLHFLILCIGITFPTFCQTAFNAESEGYYTIVGAFAVRENANRYNASLQQNGMNSAFGYLPSRNIYYVYTLRDANVNACLEAMRELRKNPAFWDAWVRYIRADGTDTPAAGNTSTELVAAASVQAAEETSSVVEKVSYRPENVTASRGVTLTEQPATEDTPIVETVPDDQRIIIPDKITLGNTEIFLSLYNPNKDKVADGVVQVIDAERGRLITEVKGNTYLILPDPKNKEGKITLIADVLGYRKVQKEINFNNPLEDTTFIMEMGTSLVANFEMVRYHTGDIRTLYNIYFYNDAAVMMPESKFELSQLLDMLAENTGYKIKLHGHTNGNHHGKIIRIGENGDFFSVAKDAETTVGTAKELSQSRAGVIRDWLVANGVDESRIEVKAWGGKRPLYDKHSANAKKNIRVEVEVVAE
jgi:outer membrane protein OmpA-like peptidoglycan-associated protein